MRPHHDVTNFRWCTSSSAATSSCRCGARKSTSSSMKSSSTSWPEAGSELEQEQSVWLDGCWSIIGGNFLRSYLVDFNHVTLWTTGQPGQAKRSDKTTINHFSSSTCQDCQDYFRWVDQTETQSTSYVGKMWSIKSESTKSQPTITFYARTTFLVSASSYEFIFTFVSYHFLQFMIFCSKYEAT